jgi:hypothetical protein
MGSIGWVRSNAWHWLFSSTHSTIAFSGGFRYSPTISRSFSMKNGSLDNLKYRCRWGCSPKVFHTRCTVDFEIPICLAIVRQLQWVPSSGFVFSVLRISAANRSSSMLRGRPGRSSSYNPSMPCSTKRLRHLPTVSRVVDSCSAMWMFFIPCAAFRTILARSTCAWGKLRDEAKDSSCCFCSSVKTTGLAIFLAAIFVPPVAYDSLEYTTIPSLCISI